MSADSYNACPNCYHLATGVPINEITQLNHLNKAAEVGVDDDSLREYYEIYLNKGHVVLEYHGAACENCDFTIDEFKSEHPFLEEMGD